nr:Chain A, Matrix protein 2 [synthetic construct]2H95_B Chain B, Matrix protein 2 [synthetic construct]2H95_C Chain C, Matrix protein 2 [synthetic construct]2H95_D Chain D, Matrix protein 2 [synthetic construct]
LVVAASIIGILHLILWIL